MIPHVIRRISSLVSDRALRTIAYGLALMGGIGMVVWSPLMILHSLGGPATDALGWLVILSATACLVSQLGGWVAGGWWRVEWVALWPLGAGVSGYALIAWLLSVQQWPGRLVEAAWITVVAVGLAMRIRSLSRLDRATRQAHTRGEIGRALGGTDGPDHD